MSSGAGDEEDDADEEDELDDIVIGSVVVLILVLGWFCTIWLFVATGPLLALIPIRDPALTFFGHCIGHGQLVV